MAAARAGRMLRVVTPDGPADERFGRSGDRVLVIEAIRLIPQAVMTDPHLNIVLTPFRAVDPGFISRTAPQVVVAPLFGHGFDILDVCARLLRSNFRGRVIALSHPLPDPEGVLHEIRGDAGAIEIDLIEVPKLPAARTAPPRLRRVPG
ncbi:MAG: hypothetical protein N2422_00470 [Rhodobacteraceae bacterium]|nr:hypothetical protein [Paracoccaceae bacterium]